MTVKFNKRNLKFLLLTSIVLTLLILLSLDNCERIKNIVNRRKIKDCPLKRQISPLTFMPLRRQIEHERNLWSKLDANNWPPERFFSNVNLTEEDDGEQTVKLINFNKKWPLPLSPVESGGRYILYDCHKQGCGGWGNRLMGILSAYFLAIMTDRSLIIRITKPCSITKFLKPRMVDWYVEEDDFELDTKKSFTLPIPRRLSVGVLKKLIDALMNRKQKIVSYTVAVPAYVMMFAKQKSIRELLLKKGFTEEELSELNYFQIPTKYNVYDILFKLQPELQAKKDEILSAVCKRKLICAHLRTGALENPNSYMVKVVRAKEMIYKFLERQLERREFEHAKVFIASDSKEIETDYKRRFGKKALIVRGSIVHVERWKDKSVDKNTACDGFAKVILDWEILGECNLLVSLPGRTFAATSIMRNIHRKEIYTLSFSADEPFIAPMVSFQRPHLRKLRKEIEGISYINCNLTTKVLDYSTCYR
ncbi:DgyrCDS14318 [Dimorphilus gyrociliatus]|uniref:DgyrCDS14318 n=1 Tax=Dimorphilus gyrociliatus TaxID=2664684 RepID=A0A7I8WDA1_9ANNE|nr:DgyrCDS14318 [Dimorphilus gyrociliatus]